MTNSIFGSLTSNLKSDFKIQDGGFNMGNDGNIRIHIKFDRRSYLNLIQYRDEIFGYQGIITKLKDIFISF